MKKFITAVLIGLSLTTFGRGIEEVQTQTLNINFHAKKVSSKTFKKKGARLIKELASTVANEFQLKPSVAYKRIGASSIKVKIQYSRLGKILVKQTYELSKQSRELFVKTIYYYGYSEYKLQLDGVNQTYEHNPDSVNIDNSNTNVNSNVNKIKVRVKK